MLKRILLLCLAGISLLLIWLNINNYRDAQPLADEMLFSIAHSLHAAIEFSAQQDPSLQNLSSFHSHDVVYFALVDNKGIYRYHSNKELIGTQVQESHLLQKMSTEMMTGHRVRLTTGEEAYELFTHVQVPNDTLRLHLVLHTRRADAVIRSARINMVIKVTLLIFSWFLAALIYRYARREEVHKIELSRQENLARIGEMGAMLAHEIRNPLAGIKGFAQLIERKPEDARTKDSAQRIITETLRLEELTTDLLAYARSDEFSVTTVQVANFIEETVDMVRHEAEQSQVVITTECSQELDIRGNRDRLSQVLLNIIRNGLQAMPGGGNLAVTVKPSDTYVSIMVTDSGHGIKPDDMQKIFEPFFTTKARGTGLGLALCRKIIVEHNGTINIESSPTGTKVTIILPVACTRRGYDRTNPSG